MEIEMLQDLIDDLNDTKNRNAFIKMNLRNAIETNDIDHVKEYYNLLVQGEDLAKDIFEIINDYAICN